MLEGSGDKGNDGFLWSVGFGQGHFFFLANGLYKDVMKAASGNTHLNIQLIEDLSKSGVFFKHSDQNITLLKETSHQKVLSQGR